jgi:hypothetical protein
MPTANVLASIRELGAAWGTILESCDLQRAEARWGYVAPRRRPPLDPEQTHFAARD